MPPLVSICCVTYNHADTVAQALEGFLAQRDDVAIEVLVHDDASTDGTEEILRRYAAQYPEIVKPLFETENQYSRGVSMDATFNFPRATGQYIALCEGDDYWCDPHKLRDQLAQMDAHPGCTFCFTNGYVRDMSGAAEDRPFIPYYPAEAVLYVPQTREMDVAQVAGLTFIPTASFLFPRATLAQVPRELLLAPCPSGDLRMKLLFTAAGKALYVHAFTCVYRLNAASSVMARWGAEAAQKTRLRCGQMLDMLDGVDRYSGGKYHKALMVLMDAQRRVLLEAVPKVALLRDPAYRRVLRALPWPRRVKCAVKAITPETLFRKIKAVFRRAQG